VRAAVRLATSAPPPLSPLRRQTKIYVPCQRGISLLIAWESRWHACATIRGFAPATAHLGGSTPCGSCAGSVDLASHYIHTHVTTGYVYARASGKEDHEFGKSGDATHLAPQDGPGLLPAPLAALRWGHGHDYGLYVGRVPAARSAASRRIRPALYERLTRAAAARATKSAGRKHNLNHNQRNICPHNAGNPTTPHPRLRFFLSSSPQP